jgi:hypothetical protein
MGGHFKDNLTGRTFTRWTVLRRGVKPKHWLCRCACGATREVLSQNLLNGYSRSCGCLPKKHNGPSQQEIQRSYVDSVVRSIRDGKDSDAARAAFRKAQAAGRSVPECYLAAVDVVQTFYPECSREYIGRRAVAIILDFRMKLLVQCPIT